MCWRDGVAEGHWCVHVRVHACNMGAAGGNTVHGHLQRMLRNWYCVRVRLSSIVGARGHAPARAVSACTRPRARTCRPVFDVILVTLLVAAIIAQCLVMPGLCFAAQRHSAKWLVPYMTWRIALTLLVLGMAVYATTVYRNQSTLPFDEWFNWLVVPPTVAEVRQRRVCTHTCTGAHGRRLLRRVHARLPSLQTTRHIKY
jgi:hypothetical protein